MSVVLWGARRGDVQYNSRDYWARNIPFGASVLMVASTSYFGKSDLGGLLYLNGTSLGSGAVRIVGIEPPTRVGVVSA